MKLGIILFLVSFHGTRSARILVLPCDHYSHLGSLLPAAYALRQAGHDVNVLVSSKYERLATHEYQVPALVLNVSEEASLHSGMEKMIEKNPDFFLSSNLGDASVDQLLRPILKSFCDELFFNREILSYIKTYGFELLIIDNFPFHHCMYVLGYKFDIPYISIGYWPVPYDAGVMVLPSQGAHWSSPYRGRMTLVERLSNTFLWILFSRNQYTNFLNEADIAKYVPEKPPVTYRDLIQRSEMHLITYPEYCFDFPKMQATNYRYIGSFAENKQVNPLPQHIQEYIGSADQGIVVVSFGSYKMLRKSVVPLLGPLMIALGQLNQKVVLIFDKEYLTDIPNNILVLDWINLNDILGEPRMRLFVTHGGINSHMEAAYRAVPTLTLPFWDEQYGNGMRAKVKGHGNVIHWKDVTTEKLVLIMRDLIENTTYKENLLNCKEILEYVPSARKQFVYWTEYVLKFGGNHLKPIGLQMDSLDFLMLDILFLAWLVCSLGFIVLYCCCSFTFHRLISKKLKSKLA